MSKPTAANDKVSTRKPAAGRKPAKARAARPAAKAAPGKPRRSASARKPSGTRQRRTSSAPAVPSRLFDVTNAQHRAFEGALEWIPLEQITLAKNPRRDISPEGIDRLAGMLMGGQLQATIGRRTAPEQVLLYAGQRRFLAAKRSHELAGGEGYEGRKPVAVLLVLLLDYEPTARDIRRIQAQENQYEELSMRDRQCQFEDCWLDRAGLPEQERLASVCEELGISATLARNLRRQLTLPVDLRTRVADRPTGDQLSITMANVLAEMNEISPELTEAVAARITTSEHHQQALTSIGAFVQRTVVENEDLYAVRLDEGLAILDGREHIERARAHLTDPGRETLATAIACKPEELDPELGKLAERAERASFKVDVDRALRERASAGRYAWVYDRGADYADAVWVIAPEFVIGAIHEAMDGLETQPVRDESYFGAAKVTDEDTKQAAAADRERRAEARERQQSAQNSNLGLGHDIAAGLMDPRSEQLDAVRRILAHLLVEHYAPIIAYGAGWSDRARQQPVGDTGRFEPKHIDAILDGELQRALEDPDPLHGILQLLSRWAAAFVLDVNGVPATGPLGSGRVARKLARALPEGSSELRTAVWELIRPMLSPHLAELNRDAFLTDDTLAPAADLAVHRAESALADVDLGEERLAA